MFVITDKSLLIVNNNQKPSCTPASTKSRPKHHYTYAFFFLVLNLMVVNIDILQQLYFFPH